MSMRILPALLGVSAVLAAPVAAGRRAVPAHAARHRAGHRRRGRDRRQRRHRRGDRRRSAGAATPSTRRSPRPACSASSSRTRAASAAAASWSSATPGRQGHDDRLAREGAGGDAARLVHRERHAARRSTTPATAACPPACPARRRGWDNALRSYGTGRFEQALRARHRRRAQGLRGRPDVLRPDRRRTSPYFDDIPSTAALYLDPDGTPRDVGTVVSATRTWRAPTSGSARLGAKRGFYRGPVADAMVARRAAAADRADRRPHLAARPDDRARPARLPRDRARADARRLPRPRRLRHGPAVLGGSTVGEALNILEDSPGCGALTDDRQAATTSSRRRATRSPTATRTSATRRSSTSRSRACCRTRFAAERARADRPDRRRPAPSPPATRRRRRAGEPAVGDVVDRVGSTTHLSVADKHGQRRDLHVHDRVDRRQRRSSSRAAASCSTTS